MSKMNIKPLHNNVLIEPLVDGSGIKTKAGIYIPETIDKSRQGGTGQGIVVALGPGKRDESGKIIPMSVKKGQKVIFSKYSSEEIKVADKKYYIINEDNILAVYE